MQKIIRALAFASSILVGAVMPMGAAHAQSACSFNPESSRFAQLTHDIRVGSMTIGRDIPDGTIIYEHDMDDRANTSLWCTGSSNVITTYSYTSNPRPLAAWNNGPYAGKVYETGVPGIGVVLEMVNSSNGATLVFPSTFSEYISSPGARVPYDGVQRTQSRLKLIKIGNVSPGIILAANLPRAQRVVGGLLVTDLKFSGSVDIVSRTCATPDVSVFMGLHTISTFSGVGSTSRWTTFDIRLDNCPVFHGRFVRGYTTGNPILDGPAFGRIGNAIGMMLSPVTSVIGLPADGIVSLSAAPNGAPTATGVGLQIAMMDGTPVTLNSVGSSGINTETGAESHSIALQARYIQTESQVTPGRADTSVMFTINYQ